MQAIQKIFYKPWLLTSLSSNKSWEIFELSIEKIDFFHFLHFLHLCILRDNVSKNLPSWNLGGRQIVSGPIFSDSPYKNRLVANFSALEDLFWPKFSTFSTRGVRTGQNWRKNLFVPQVPNFIRFAWNSFLRSKTMSAMRFRLNFD